VVTVVLTLLCHGCPLRVQLKLMAASKLSGLLEFLLGPVIVPRPIGPVDA
jgi:hypothetical protein